MWYQQPSDFTGFDFGNSLTNGLQFVVNESFGKRDQIWGKAPSSSAAAGSVGLGGEGVIPSTGGNGDKYFPSLNGSSTYTVATIISDVRNGAVRNPFDGDDTTNTRIFQLRINASNACEFIGFNTSGSPSTATSGTVAAGTPVVLMGVMDSAKKPNVYCTGTTSGQGSALTGTVRGIVTSSRLSVGERVPGDQVVVGPVYACFYWDRALSAAEIASFLANPWQVFDDPSDEDAIFLAPLASGSTGTSATTNANDTSTAAGTTTITGTSAKTNANDTSSASGTTTVVGSSATTNAADTSSASGSVGNACTGTVAVTNAADTSSAAGTTTVTGSSARSNANDSSSASGTTTVLGTASATNSSDISAASGYVGGVTGTAAATNANDISSASGIAKGSKVGGDDVPYRWETWPKKKKTTAIKQARKAVVDATGEEPTLEAIKEAAKQLDPAEWFAQQEELVTRILAIQREMEEQDDEEALILLL